MGNEKQIYNQHLPKKGHFGLNDNSITTVALTLLRRIKHTCWRSYTRHGMPQFGNKESG